MTHLIDKDAVLAEIVKIKTDALQKKSQCKRSGLERIIHQIKAYNKVISLIDTLEVKEVDLEKEIKEVQRDYKTIDEYEGYFATIYASDIEWMAKHFFELGLKAQKCE